MCQVLVMYYSLCLAILGYVTVWVLRVWDVVSLGYVTARQYRGMVLVQLNSRSKGASYFR